MHVRSHGAALPSWPPRPSICKSAPRRSRPRRHLHLRLQHAGDDLAVVLIFLVTCTTPAITSIPPSSSRPRPPVIYKEPESATAPAPNRGQEASQGSEEKPWRPCSSPEMRQGVTWSIYDQLLRRPPSSRCTSHMVPHPAERRPHHHRQLLRLARQRSGDPIIIDGYFGLLASGAVTPPSSTATSACSPSAPV
ncbi:hypothetical protein PVAP13_3NG163201 [Panicum virgatum]|uniref:Uncharacterized protein n=1 Tax=Panicum virgatum TaxID=38727 RepID=A0A8T0UHK6_PANVG|nr:hypothetical protein PVAP13_3NG163201 [Panicum virgatum]